ncbi:PREDICTED: transcription initiation factor TFIID subunit 12-like [Amphimedon queenslandica]|uniref:Transcription initiation factor TFIID subunit 12 n=1 Tax=Amphimedon queenslandica TaxID=400682 RepID=A0A1X7VP93_AMPQE|nr:PREDICTED: transcription initiation factor TFIID subunit 12-like [Amphimedon queenslandica]|eukprot:XP_003383271.1 PREDICTED: transcription initiation factor TFIID subunit 12-like [Amphimedon queenslandica]
MESSSKTPLNRKRLHDLVREVDPNQTLDEDAEELLMQLADDFIESVVSSSCRLAKHRKSSTLELKDLQVHLENSWNMWLPGFPQEGRSKPPPSSGPANEAHKQRLSLIKKSKK